MSEHEQLNERDREQVEERHEHGAEHYRKVYLTLLVLLVLSVAGPFLGIVWVTLITAFGIALVKANLVIQNFMHLRWEKRLVKWVLISSLVLMALFVAGVAPDVMRHEGQNWVNVAQIKLNWPTASNASGSATVTAVPSSACSSSLACSSSIPRSTASAAATFTQFWPS